MNTYHGIEPPESEDAFSLAQQQVKYMEEFEQIMEDLIQEPEDP
jgi:hypothetical protein